MSTSASLDEITLSAQVAHGGRPKSRGGLEVDIFEHRQEIVWRRGEVHAAKRRMNRRDRRQGRRTCRVAVGAVRAS